MAGVDSREVEAGGRRYMQHMVKGLGYAKVTKICPLLHPLSSVK